MHRFRHVGTGLVVGLGWGLFAALLEGLPLLLEGSPWPFLGPRLLALACLAVLYGVLCAFAGGVVGTVTWLVLRLFQRRVSRAALAASCAGVLAATTATVLAGQRFAPRVLGWVIVIILSAALGLMIGRTIYRAAQRRATSWRTYRRVVGTAYLVAVVAVLAVAGFRAWLRDLPSFNPPVTEATATAERPNIVLVTAAGVRPDHLGAYGYDPEISPNVDALAGRGVRFEQAIAQASWTEPSLASLLTSLYPSELAIACRAAIYCQPHLDAERVTLAEALQVTGYRTQAYLSSPWLTAGLGFAQGFDGFESVRTEEPFDLGPMRAGTLGWLLGCRRDSAACQLVAESHARLFDTPIPPGWGGDRVNARVTRFLEYHSGERFFLWVHYTEALPPYDLEPPFRPLPADPQASPERRLKRLGYWELGDPFTAREELLPHDVAGLTALYDAEVHRVDRLVGGLTGLLEAHGLTDRTLVVFASDHGQEFLEHGGYTYGHTLHSEVLHVPLLVAGPGVASPGRVVETPVALLDLVPTLIEVAGATVPPEAEGRSLMSALHGEVLEDRAIWSESLYRVPTELKAMQRSGYKLVYDVGDGGMELYDLTADPAEERNIAAEATQIAETMRSSLLDWMAHTAQVARDLPRAAPPAELGDAGKSVY
jgi:arylsulfatase A-like enzyme